MNSMEFNKIAGATIGALLVFLLLNFFSGMIYGTRSGAEHVVASDEEGPVLAYAVPIEAADTGAAPEEEQLDLHAIFADADPANGEKAFRACGACHSVNEGENKVGPSLYDVVGNQVAHLASFNYSDAMEGHGGDWTPELLFDFLGDPKGVVPGTKMSYAGMSNPQQRADVIAYLNETGGTPIDLTEGLEPVAGEDEQAADSDAETEIASADDAEAAEDEAADGGAETTDQPEADSSTEDTATPPESVEGEAEVTDVEEVDTGDEAVDVESTTPVEVEEEAPAAAADDAAETEEAPAEEAPATEGEATEDEAAGDEAATVKPAAEQPETADEAAEADTEVAAASDSPFLAGDAAEGEKVFRRCRACHRIEEGVNGVGPSLHDIVGREIATVDGFNYSGAMESHGGNWTPEFLSEFIADPKAAIPGNKMGFAGLKNEQDRINVITYLNEAAN